MKMYRPIFLFLAVALLLVSILACSSTQPLAMATTSPNESAWNACTMFIEIS
jgi:hypothetical protein